MDRGGGDLTAIEEEAAEETDEAAIGPAAASSSSRGPPVDGDENVGARDVGEQPNEEAVVPAGPESAVQRRNRVVRVDAGVQADSEGADWTDWSLSRALRLLRSPNPMVVKRTLRKLHIRLWHAPAARMKDMLSAAGAPPV